MCENKSGNPFLKSQPTSAENFHATSSSPSISGLLWPLFALALVTLRLTLVITPFSPSNVFGIGVVDASARDSVGTRACCDQSAAARVPFDSFPFLMNYLMHILSSFLFSLTFYGKESTAGPKAEPFTRDQVFRAPADLARPCLDSK